MGGPTVCETSNRMCEKVNFMHDPTTVSCMCRPTGVCLKGFERWSQVLCVGF